MQDINIEFNTFVGGILTEANPINYPQGFTLDEENFILKRDGTRQRRRGLEIKDQTTSTSLKYTQTGGWLGEGTLPWPTEQKLLVWAKGSVSTFRTDLSSSIEASEVVIHTGTDPITAVTTYKSFIVVTVSQDVTYQRLDGTTVDIATPTVLVYDVNGVLLATNTFAVRDFAGISDDLELDERPLGLGLEHRYNLLNQGWSEENITTFSTTFQKYPSHADNMNSGLDADTGAFTASWVDLANAGKSKSTGGRAIVQLFQRQYARESYLHSIIGDTPDVLDSENLVPATDPTPSQVEYAGRLFYLVNAGGPGGNNQTQLLFSKTDASAKDLCKCYQDNDPTSRDNSFLLATDGGVLEISDVGRGVRLVPLKDRLFIFGTNGVFELSSSNGPLTPASMHIRKISSEGVVNPTAFVGRNGRSIVLAEDSIYYWADAGIMKASYDSSSGLYVVKNMTSDKIQQLYNDIRYLPKQNAFGFYVPSDQTIRFLYNVVDDKDSTSVSDSSKYRQELIYNIPLDAWYKNKFYTIGTGGAHFDDTQFIFSAFVKEDTENLPTSLRLGLSPSIRYVVTNKEQGGASQDIHFANYSTTTFEDYTGTLGAGEVQAFLQTGYVNAGDSARRKQADYIVPSFIRTEDGFTDDGNGNLTPTNESSCKIQAHWDFSDSGSKVGTSFEAYKYNSVYIPTGPSDTFDYGQSVITTKNKLLGRGRALSLRFSTSAGKDCRLLGWNLGLESTSKV